MCDSPYFHRPSLEYADSIPFPCGRCPVCKRRRVNQWVFRLRQEDKISKSSLFVTLTYGSKVPLTSNGYMTLQKRDFQLFLKRLRKIQAKKCDWKIKYYAAGEYGEQRFRPHYHAIMFNVFDMEDINKAWQLGDIHVGKVSGASIAYTAKYIDKSKRIPLHARDDRQKEFSLMSKGLGSNYLTPAMIKYHKRHLQDNYVTDIDGNKIAIPRYYRDRIFTDDERMEARFHINTQKYRRRNLKRRRVEALYQDRVSLEAYEDSEKIGRYNKFYSKQKLKTRNHD